MIPSDSPFARCYDLCGDHMAAIVFERLTYWWRGTRVLKGTEWRVKPRAQLARECRMTEKQCRRALEVLKNRHLVETEAHRFGTTGPVMHYRILPRGQAFFTDKTAQNTDENAPISEGSVMALEGQNLDHNGGMLSNNPYGFSYENPPGFLDAKGLSQKGFSGKNESVTHEGGSLPKKGNMMAEGYGNSLPKKNTPKAPSNAKLAVKAKLGMSAAAILGAKKVDGVFPGACS